MQLEEEELNRKRAANKTALEAIGGKKKKRKLDEALESLQNATTPGSNANATSSAPNSHSTSQVRIIPINSIVNSLFEVLDLVKACIYQSESEEYRRFFFFRYSTIFSELGRSSHD